MFITHSTNHKHFFASATDTLRGEKTLSIHTSKNRGFSNLHLFDKCVMISILNYTMTGDNRVKNLQKTYSYFCGLMKITCKRLLC